MTASAPICPACNRPATETKTGHGIRHDCCGLHSWHGKPLVDQATHNARQEAHRYFDALWHFRLMSRSEAYKKLAKAMGLHPRDCHISRMTKEQALSVKNFAKQISGTNSEPSRGEAHDRTSNQRTRHHVD